MAEIVSVRYTPGTDTIEPHMDTAGTGDAIDLVQHILEKTLLQITARPVTGYSPYSHMLTLTYERDDHRTVTHYALVTADLYTALTPHLEAE